MRVEIGYQGEKGQALADGGGSDFPHKLLSPPRLYDVLLGLNKHRLLTQRGWGREKRGRALAGGPSKPKGSVTQPSAQHARLFEKQISAFSG